MGDIVAVSGTVARSGSPTRISGDATPTRRSTPTRAPRPASGEAGSPGALDGVRRRAERGLAQGLAAPEAALLRGMVLGEDERLSEEVRDDFQRSGLAHILAVSGQNVMLLVVLVLAACALIGVPLRARLVLAAAVVVALRAAGRRRAVDPARRGDGRRRAWSPRSPGGRRGAGTRCCSRPRRRSLLNPRAAGEPGWQLSFAAVAALLVGAAPLRGGARAADARPAGRRGRDHDRRDASARRR